MQQPAPRKHFFDWTISIGNLITIIALFLASFISYIHWTDTVTTLQAQQIELKETQKEITITQNQMQERMAAQTEISQALRDRIELDERNERLRGNR